jgi:hypothetical protein
MHPALFIKSRCDRSPLRAPGPACGDLKCWVLGVPNPLSPSWLNHPHHWTELRKGGSEREQDAAARSLRSNRGAIARAPRTREWDLRASEEKDCWGIARRSPTTALSRRSPRADLLCAPPSVSIVSPVSICSALRVATDWSEVSTLDWEIVVAGDGAAMRCVCVVVQGGRGRHTPSLTLIRIGRMRLEATYPFTWFNLNHRIVIVRISRDLGVLNPRCQSSI